MDPTSGGPCQGIRNSIPQLRSYGVETEVVSLDHEKSEFIQKDSFLIHAIGESKGPWQYNSKLLSWLIENISKYDCVIIHALWLYHGFAVHKAIIGKRLKMGNSAPLYFVMPHGMLDPYFQNDKTRKLKALRNKIYWKYIESRIVNDADGILFTCEEELLLARNTFKGYQPKREINIGYGIPSNTSFNKINNQLPYLLFLSRIHPKKGVDLLIAAYEEVATEYKDIPNLLIVGPGLDTHYGKNIYASVQANLEIRDKISFNGMLTGDAKWDVFYNCEAFILPSHQENFGIAVVEALSCGKPVLITDKVNIWREIQAENAGFVESDTKAGIKQLLRKWIDLTGEQKVDMSNSAKNCYVSNFTVEIAAAKMINSLSSIFESRLQFLK